LEKGERGYDSLAPFSLISTPSNLLIIFKNLLPSPPVTFGGLENVQRLE